MVGAAHVPEGAKTVRQVASPGYTVQLHCSNASIPFHFSTGDNNHMRGHGWYKHLSGDWYCIATVVVSMEYTKSLSKAMQLRIDTSCGINGWFGRRPTYGSPRGPGVRTASASRKISTAKVPTATT
jgi:hypothetical protein